MMITLKYIGKGLKQQLAKRNSLMRISNWAYDLYLARESKLDEKIEKALEKLYILGDGPGFEYSYEQLQQMAEDLINTDEYDPAIEDYCCRVCGLEQKVKPWGDDGRSPKYDVCDCCGAMFGQDDQNIESIQKYRTEWMSSGGKWVVPNSMPMGWVVERQMKQIPKKYN